MKKFHWLALGTLILISGCIPSIYPLYTDDTLTFDASLIGQWREDNGPLTTADGKTVYPTWQFERGNEEDTYYTLLHTSEDGKSSEYEVHLVKLGGNLYFDFFPDGDHASIQDLDDLLQIHLFPVHTFAKVEITKEQVMFNFFDADWLGDLIEQRKIRIRHEEVDGMLLLSAGTEELQKFVEKYGDDDKAYIDPVILKKEMK